MAAMLANPVMIRAGRHERQAAAGARCQVRVRVPHAREEPGLRVHGVRPAV